MSTIYEVKRQNEGKLLKIKGVVSVGIGFGVSKIPIIIVGLENDKPELVNKIPKSLEGYVVEIQVTGNIKAL